MNSLSISFTLAKQSQAHGANIEHNNRDYIASNIDISKVHQNINYIRESPEKAYEKLFSNAVKEYNAKQKQPCRKIGNYYEHILKSRREEAFYEAVIQFGDRETASCDSENGCEAKKMLDEYIKDFHQRNPNLYVFNAALHLDEATPHLHINFIPFYTTGRKNGLSKGVSLKAALNEQGFTAKNYKENRLVAWEESERNAMEKILNKHGFVREDKNAKHQHMNVNEYKNSMDEKNMLAALSKIKRVSPEETSVNNVTKLKEKLKTAEYEKKKLSEINESEYTPCYYSSPDKLSFVLAELDKKNIQYIETDTGFEIKKCYLEQVRETEKQYKPVRSPLREKLRNDIDRLLLSSQNTDDLLKKLEEEKYTIKHGKYISVRPEHGEKFIRLKSLGEFYSEFALQNRIAANHNFEHKINEKLKTVTEENDFERMTLRSISVYTIAVKRGSLPLKKRNPKRPFGWTNDKELDKLTALNAQINSGVTLDSLKQNFESSEEKVNNLINKIEASKADLKYFTDLKENIEIVFEGKSSDSVKISESKKILSSFKDFEITKENYKNIDVLIYNEVSNLKQLNTELTQQQSHLKKDAEYYEFAKKVAGGTYVQSLVHDEKIRRLSDYVPKGFTVG